VVKYGYGILFPNTSKGGILKVREIIKRLERDGWEIVKTKGDHRQFKHPLKRGKVTVPGHPGDDIKPNILASIRRQAGL
jgi:predicted RNA binding protein YcfA (HicA-like mRNA interferase family)